MANLSNINNKLVVTTDGAALINQGTVDYGTAKLQVSGSGSTGTITWRNDGGRKTGYLYSDSAGVAIYSTTLNNAGIYLADNIHIDFRVNGGVKMLIDSSGNVKIGNSTTGTPAANADDLVIDKGASESGITLISTAAASIRFGDAANTSIGSLEYNHNSNYMRMIVNNEEKVRIDSSGNVGIGTTLPQSILSLSKTDEASYTPATAVDYSLMLGTRNGNAAGTSDDLGPGIVWKYNDAGGSYTKKSAGIMQVGEGNYLRSGLAFYTNNNADQTTVWSEKMRLSMDGNVGIGGTSTGSKLEIIGGGYNSIRIGSNQTANTNKQSGISMNNYEGNGTSIFQTFQQNNDNSIYWGSADTGFRGVQNHYFMVNADSNATTGHTTAMRIASAGQIGIGRLTTSYKLSLITDSTAQNGVYISGGTGNGNHAFYVENQAGSAEFFAVRGDGEIRLNATSGHTYANTGIRFGANAVSNNLDDYEEGTFTMTMTNDGVGNTVTSRYTKVGRLVFIEAYFSARTISNAGNCRVSGLPFSADASEGYGVLTYWHGTAISQNGTVFYVQGSIADGVAPGTTAYAQWVTGTNKAIMLAGFYTTA
jgi:hypothetical protein